MNKQLFSYIAYHIADYFEANAYFKHYVPSIDSYKECFGKIDRVEGDSFIIYYAGSLHMVHYSSVNLLITNGYDVRNFFRYLIHDRHIMFHPDDSFDQYGLDSHDAKIYDDMMHQCFDVMDSTGVDIYELALDEFQKFFKR